MIALVVIIIYMMARKLVTFKEAMECVPQGFIAMVPAITILTMAASLKNISNGLLGSAGYVGRPRGEGPSDELGYALSPDWWGRGLMPEVCLELLRYGFEDMGLGTVWCTHYGENGRSRRVIEKCGFVYAFTEKLTDEFFPDRPTCFYFLTRQDWEGRRHG